MSILRRIQGWFGFYCTGYEYQIKVDDITIPMLFFSHPPKTHKMVRKLAYYRDHGDFDKAVYLTKDMILVDGYITYLLAKREHLRWVPAVFVEDDAITNRQLKEEIKNIRENEEDV
ncbi:MAG: hypothetical protein LUC17_04080 [Oscillospiraceae bacterium]|nr:hypothetical protein [Oscillospiraceae bacterium]